MSHLTTDQKWRAAATQLVDKGYVMQEASGIVPAVFTHPERETLYLILKFTDGTRMRDRQWTAVPLADKPVAFGLIEAAEHLGCAVSTLKHAMSADAKHPLIPDQRLGNRNLVFFEETLATWSEQRAGRGAKPTDRYMSYDRLYLINRQSLIEMALRHLASGKLEVGPFADALALETHQNRWDLVEMANQRRTAFEAELQKLPRATLIELMADNYTETPGEGATDEEDGIEVLVYDE